jgi:hypothetical protein
MHALGARLGSDHAMLTTIVASHTGVLDHGDLLAAIAAM